MKEDMFRDGSKTEPHGCQDVLPPRQIDFLPETSQSGKARPCPQSQWRGPGCWAGKILGWPSGDLPAIVSKKQT